jgi:hypothetical protein
MRVVKLLGLVLFSSACLAPVAAADQLFEYKLDKLGVTSALEACEAQIQSIAQKFAQQSGITPFAAGCAADEYDRGFLNGAISYFANERVKVLSSRDRRGGIETDGGYKTMEACQASLPRRVSQFQTVYGTEPMAAYCHQMYQSSRTYAALVEAIGESEIVPIFAGFTFFGRPVGEPAEILASLKATADEKFPGRVMDASFDGSLGYAHGVIRYYNTERVRLHNLDEMKFKTVEACVESLGTVESILNSFTDKPAVLFCTADGLSGIRSNIVTFTMEIGSPDTYTWYQSPTTYATREQCVAGAGGLSSGRLAGTICTDTVPSVLHMILRTEG